MIHLRQTIASLRLLLHGLTAAPAKGQTNVEYALILVLVAIAAAAILIVVGQNIGVVLSSVNVSLTNP